jgi:hypothetical protein
VSKPENPPAFPGEVRSSTGVAIVGMNSGMTLRDWFAGQALAGMLAGAMADGSEFNLADDPTKFARATYRIADAMLAQRERDGVK